MRKIKIINTAVIVFFALLLIAVNYIHHSFTSSKTPLEKERDSVYRVFQQWEKEQKVRDDIGRMKKNMQQDSYDKIWDRAYKRVISLERQMDSIYKYKTTKP